MESPFVKCPHTCEYEPMGSQNQIMALLEGRHIIPNVVSSGGLEHVKEHILGDTYHPNCHQECLGSRYRQANTIEPLFTPRHTAFEGIVPQILTFFDNHTQLILRFFKNIAVDVSDEDIPRTATLAPWVAPIHPSSTRFAPGSVCPRYDAAPSLQLDTPYDIPYDQNMMLWIVLDSRPLAEDDYGHIDEIKCFHNFHDILEGLINHQGMTNHIRREEVQGKPEWVVSEWVGRFSALSNDFISTSNVGPAGCGFDSQERRWKIRNTLLY